MIILQKGVVMTPFELIIVIELVFMNCFLWIISDILHRMVK